MIVSDFNAAQFAGVGGVAASVASTSGGCGCRHATSTSPAPAAAPALTLDRRDRHDLVKMVLGGLITAFLVRAIAD